MLEKSAFLMSKLGNGPLLEHEPVIEILRYRNLIFYLIMLIRSNNHSVMFGNYLQQTTSADDIFRCIFFLGALRVKVSIITVAVYRFYEIFLESLRK